MRTLTQSNVTQLITDYKQVKKNLENIQVQMSRTVQAALVEGQLADPAILLNVKGCLQQAEAVLNDYTAGFLRFSRSMAKTQNANKPDEKFLENVRAIRSDAEDILQETFVRALKNLHQYTAGTNFIGWLCAVGRSLALKYHG